MNKEILINAEDEQEKRVAIIIDGRLEEYFIERPKDLTTLGNIYKGRVESVVPSVGAAFVDITLPKKGFLYLSDYLEAPEPFDNFTKTKVLEPKIGEEILVQITRESFGTKGPRITTHIALPGRYLVLMPQDVNLGISRRIDDQEERRRLLDVLYNLDVPDKMGVIVRTAAFKRTKKDIARDLKFLLNQWGRIKRIVQKKSAPSLIYQEYDLTLRVIRDYFTEDVTKVLVDSKKEFVRVKKFVRMFLRNLSKRITYYKNDVPLFLNKNIEHEIDKIYHNKVYMKSGAYLVIEPTEGLVVIDVNSGHFKKKRLKQEEAIFLINTESAREIARQLRLRDLGGIIVIDFIDMEKERHRKSVLKTLKEALRQDRAKADVLEISKFGLVQMTRERIMRTPESLSYQACPYCRGRGKVKSISTMSIHVIKELRGMLSKKRFLELNVLVNPDVAGFLLSNNSHSLKTLERRFRTKIFITPNPNLHIEEINII